MKMYDTPREIGAYLNRPLECACGRTHYVPIKAVRIGPGALEALPELLKEQGYQSPFLLCDPITYRVAGERCETLMKEAGIPCSVHVLTHLDFDEATLGEIVVSVPSDADVMIGVGTGSITDMTRYSSFRLSLPCFTVATGAPMDGFAASIGILNVNRLKLTLPAHCTEAILGDTDILKTAPYRMTVAGFGDLIGKVNCLSDWKLARIVNGEHFCPAIVELVEDCVRKILADAPRIRERDPAVLGEVMKGLVVSGAAISLYGDSRPASGAEHHFSHYWETVYDQRGEQHAMHGEQVATGTVLMLMLAEELLKTTPDFDMARRAAENYDPAAWETEIRRAYGAAAQEVVDLEARAGKNTPEGRLRRIDSMEEHWEAIRAQLRTLPSAKELREILDTVGCPCTPRQIGVEEDVLKDAFLYAKEVRPRYTLLQLIWDLDLLDKLSDRVMARLRED